jgi:hypothetical protein
MKNQLMSNTTLSDLANAAIAYNRIVKEEKQYDVPGRNIIILDKKIIKARQKLQNCACLYAESLKT